MMYRLMLLLGIAGGMAFAVAAQTTPRPTPPAEPRTIIVTGTAERMVPPDVGLVVFAVETQADSVSRAVTDNNTISNRVMDATRRLNIRGLTIRTLGFDVQPVYEQPATGQPVTTPLRIIGYHVTNRVEVRIPEPGNNGLSAAVGRVLDAGLTAGANRIDSVSFMLENDLPVQRQVLAEATRNARGTAQAMAAAAGVQLVRLLHLSSTPFYRQPPMPVFARNAEAAQGVPIVAGPLTVQGTVTVVYEIR